jgi:negative regulator of sigma-B (phosphoserine phosphatase)
MGMNSGIHDVSSPIEWGVAGRSLDGQSESGDQYLVKTFPNGALVTVVDGLGHGPRAATVAKTAIATLEGHAHEPVASLLRRCHKELVGTRGVVMSLASFNTLDGEMTWLGVGNVIGLLLRADARAERARESLLLRGGVVGYRLPSLRPVVISVTRGDTLIFATDGLRSSFVQEFIHNEVKGLTLSDPPQRIADHIFAEHGRGTDDALVLVAQYVRSSPGGANIPSGAAP